MNQVFILLRKIFGCLTCLIFQLYYFNRLKMSFPSISFALVPFHLGKGSNTKLGKRAIIGSHCEIIAKGKIQIGNYFSINKYTRIVALENIAIGDYVTIAQFVTILDHDHAYKIVDGNMLLEGYTTSPIVIGNNVWIGDKVTICKGVTIGNNVIIGANSVVTKDIENNCIAAGNPCKKLKGI